MNAMIDTMTPLRQLIELLVELVTPRRLHDDAGDLGDRAPPPQQFDHYGGYVLSFWFSRLSFTDGVLIVSAALPIALLTADTRTSVEVS